MNYKEYQDAYFVEPRPEPRYAFSGFGGITLYFEEYDAAVSYYQKILGPPTYVEGEGTKGWPIGNQWLTLLQGNAGSPHNVEVIVQMQTPDEAERLHQAFIAAGGSGPAPSDELMYEPIRYCSVQDPFGTDWLFMYPLYRTRS